MFIKNFYSNCCHGHVEVNFHKPQKTIRQKAKNFRSKTKKDEKSCPFHFFTQLFLRTSSAQFWQLNRKEKARRPEIFCPLSEKYSKKIRFSNSCFPSSCSSGYVDCCFDRPAEKRWRKADTFWLHVRKCLTKFEEMFSHNCP